MLNPRFDPLMKSLVAAHAIRVRLVVQLAQQNFMFGVAQALDSTDFVVAAFRAGRTKDRVLAWVRCSGGATTVFAFDRGGVYTYDAAVEREATALWEVANTLCGAASAAPRKVPRCPVAAPDDWSVSVTEFCSADDLAIVRTAETEVPHLWPGIYEALYCCPLPFDPLSGRLP